MTTGKKTGFRTEIRALQERPMAAMVEKNQTETAPAAPGLTAGAALQGAAKLSPGGAGGQASLGTSSRLGLWELSAPWV